MIRVICGSILYDLPRRMTPDRIQLRDLLDADEDEGTLRIGNRRMLLFDADAMGLLRKQLIDNFGIVENALASRPYLAGSAFTMGDIPMGLALHRWFLLPIERPNHPKLKAYYDRLAARPAFKEHCAAPLS